MQVSESDLPLSISRSKTARPHESPSVDTKLLRLLGKQTAIVDKLRGLMPEEFANDLETIEPMGMAWHSPMEAVGDACDGVEDLARMIGDHAEPSTVPIAGAVNVSSRSRLGGEQPPPTDALERQTRPISVQ